MDAYIHPVSEGDWQRIAAIFNLHVADSFAAYPDQPVDESFFRTLHEANPSLPFVVAELQGLVVGFAYLSPFHRATTMRHTAALTYFLHPEYTAKGIGTAFLRHLISAGKSAGISNFIAHVSSLNPGSVRFHLNHDFTECGRLVGVGVKNGRPFDMIWFQRLEL